MLSGTSATTLAGSAAVPAAPVRHPNRGGRDGCAPSKFIWLSLVAGASLLFGTGCSMLGPLATDSSGTSVHSVDPNVPFVVVTVGGSPAATPTIGVAETIPDSTPLPRIDLPTRDPASAARPASSPSTNRAPSAAAGAARPPGTSSPAGSPVPAGRAP